MWQIAYRGFPPNNPSKTLLLGTATFPTLEQCWQQTLRRVKEKLAEIDLSGPPPPPEALGLLVVINPPGSPKLSDGEEWRSALHTQMTRKSDRPAPSSGSC